MMAFTRCVSPCGVCPRVVYVHPPTPRKSHLGDTEAESDAWSLALDDRLSSHSELELLVADHSMLQTIILILKRAMNNETWASIDWQLPSPLNALALLTINSHNVAVVPSNVALLLLYHAIRLLCLAPTLSC